MSTLPIKTTIRTKRIKIYLESPNVPGWNETDAIGLRDATRAIQGAVEANPAYSGPSRYPLQAAGGR